MRRDPVERAANEDDDLQEVATWEPRSRLDRVAKGVYDAILPTVTAVLVLLALLFLVALVAGGLFSALDDTFNGVLVVLSAVPALLLAGYVWRADVTTDEPLSLLVATFLLGLLFASFAGVVNDLVSRGAGVGISSGLLSIPFFFVVVGPVEETVKLVAVRLYAYEDGRFDAVIDGAVYGAVAGLGFATIENALYIAQQLSQGSGPFGITAVRALAGPGHVIYSGIAGYYLGLAKFNRDHAGPLVIKGLLLAALIHALYNSLVGIVPAVLAVTAGVPVALGFLGFAVVYDTAAGYYLYRKLKNYERAYHAVGAGGGPEPDAELAEFDDGLETGRSRRSDAPDTAGED